MRAAELTSLLDAAGLEAAWLGAPPETEISGLTCDSRRVGPGMLFAALSGVAADGHAYLPQALAAGAAAALVTRPQADLPLPQLAVADSRAALAILAQEFYGQPTRSMTLLGLTGTNGKTTTSYLVESILAGRGPVGVIGTVEVRYPGYHRLADMTTPESVELAALLAAMRAAGASQVVMEVSSHALAQRRVEGCLFDLGLFTNLSRDHLDYHRDLDDYFAAKRRLFSELLPAAKAAGKDPAAVVCADDARAPGLCQLAADRGLRLWTYGLTERAMVRVQESQLSLDGSRLSLAWTGGTLSLSTRLVGRYNLQNVAGAAAAGLALGLAPAQVAAGIEALPGVPGRLQRVDGPAGGPAVFVDYAHTDDALRQVLATLKPLTRGRLICVFGAGGDRDHGKRPLMGKAVAQGADLAVLTSDNPRTEDPLAIMEMVEPGLLQGGLRPADGLNAPGGFVRQPERAAAIALALSQARAEDVVLIAGKGHEDYQILGKTKRHFDDREEAARALASRQGYSHA